MTPDKPKFMYDCFLCERPFQFGPHIYAGRPIKSWGVIACHTCIDQNWDGLVPSQHPRLMQHLAEKGVAVELNGDGWLPIPSRGT